MELDKITTAKFTSQIASTAAQFINKDTKTNNEKLEELIALFPPTDIASQINSNEDKTIDELCQELNKLTSKPNLTPREEEELFYIFVECGNRGSDAKKALIPIANFFIARPENESLAKKKEKLRAKACWALSKIASSFVEQIISDEKNNKKNYPNALKTLNSIIVIFSKALSDSKESIYIKRQIVKHLDEEVVFSNIYGTNSSLISACMDLQNDANFKKQANILIYNILQAFKAALTVDNVKANATAIRALGKLGEFDITIASDKDEDESISMAKEIANVLTLWPNLDGISSNEEYQKKHRIIVSSLFNKLKKDDSDSLQVSIESALLEMGQYTVFKVADTLRYNEYIKMKEIAVNVLGRMSSYGYADCVKDDALKALALAAMRKDNNYPQINISAVKSIAMWGKSAEDVTIVADSSGNPIKVYDQLKIAFLNMEDIDLIYEIGVTMCKINPERTVHFFRYVLNLPVKSQDAERKSILIKNRRVAIFLLGKLGEHAKSEYKLIMSFLNNKDDSFLCLKAVEALGNIGRYLDTAQKKEIVDTLTSLRTKLEKQNKGLLVTKKEKEKNKKIIGEIDKALKQIVSKSNTEEKTVIGPK